MARIRAARHYQHPKAPIRLIADAGRKSLRRDLRGALPHLSELFDAKKATALIKRGQPPDSAMNWKHAQEMFKALFARWASIHQEGAALGVRKINGAFHGRGRRVRFRKGAVAVAGSPSEGADGPHGNRENRDGHNGVDLDSLFNKMKKSIGNRFNFDRFDASTQSLLQDSYDNFMADIEATAKAAINQIVQAGVKAGMSPEDIAGDIKDLIGLSPTQAQAVLNYRAMLENLDTGALQRQLRSDQYDSAVLSAISTGQSLDEAAIDEMVSAYEDNALTYRADMIAQTESVRAANLGLQDSYRQAVDRGALPDDAVRQYWQIALDERTCEICLSIPDMNPDGVPMGTSFDSIDGPQDGPPDPHPNCRCSVEIVTDLSQVPDDAEFDF